MLTLVSIQLDSVRAPDRRLRFASAAAVRHGQQAHDVVIPELFLVGENTVIDIKVIYAVLYVDATLCSGSALVKHTGEAITFQCRPTLAALFSPGLNTRWQITLSISVTEASLF
jgi:hypothetical protein